MKITNFNTPKWLTVREALGILTLMKAILLEEGEKHYIRFHSIVLWKHKSWLLEIIVEEI